MTTTTYSIKYFTAKRSRRIGGPVDGWAVIAHQGDRQFEVTQDWKRFSTKDEAQADADRRIAEDAAREAALTNEDRARIAARAAARAAETIVAREAARAEREDAIAQADAIAHTATDRTSPTERQLAYAAKLGITITPSMTRQDVSAAIDAARGDYSSGGYGGYVARRTQDRYGIRGQIWDEE